MSQARVLIIENEEQVAAELQQRLRLLGYSIVGIAVSPAEGLQMTRIYNPELLVLNLSLSGQGEGLLSEEAFRLEFDIPIVYTAPRAGQATIRRARSTGPFGYLLEPYDPSQLYATIETALLRHRFEREIRENRQWLNGILFSIGDGVIAVDRESLIRYINPTAQNLTGWPSDESVGHPLSQVFSFADGGPLNPMEGGLKSVTGLEAVLKRRDDTLIPVEINISMLSGEGSRGDGMVLAFRDIRKQQDALREIQRQASRAQTLVATAARLNANLELTSVVDTICSTTKQVLNAAAILAFLCYNPEKKMCTEAACLSSLEPLARMDRPRLQIPTAVVRSLLPDETQSISIQSLEIICNLPGWEPLQGLDLDALLFAGIFHQHELVGVLVAFFPAPFSPVSREQLELLRGLVDQAALSITNARLFEQVRIGREHERQLARSIVDIQERERRRIARELHDHLGQALTGLQFMLESVRQQVEDPKKSLLEQVQNFVIDIIGQVREMSLNLRPSMLDDLGLIPTLKWHFDRYTTQTGILVHSSMDPLAARFPPEIETAAYRIVQESLTNVARHAGVKEVAVKVLVKDPALNIEISDHGAGFDAAAVLSRHTSGLSGMAERVSLVGGWITVNSRLGHGTQVFAALPVSGEPLQRRRHDRSSPSG